MDKATYFKTIGYKPHAKQWLYHRSEARFKVPVCGRRFGKSVMAARDMGAELFLPNRRYWIVGPKYDLAEKEFRVLWNDIMINLNFRNTKGMKGRYNKKQGDMFMEFPWGTVVECRSAQHPDDLVGEGLHGVIMSEAAKHRDDTFERFIRPALADFRGWATFPTTPEGQNWLHTLWQRGHNPKFETYESWRFPSWDNPYLYPGGEFDDEMQLIRDETTDPAFFDQEYGADFTAFAGKVYKDWQESTHVTTVPYDPLLPNYMAFDFGYNSPLAAVEFQITPWDQIRVWREHYKSQMMLEDHLAVMSERKQPPGYKIDLAFGDAADPEACETISRYLAPCMYDDEAKANWRQGVELVMGFLKMRQIDTIDEMGTPLEIPGMLVDHSCINGIREFNNYKGAPGTHGRNPKSPRDLPQKIDDHFLDALRYGLMHLYVLGAQHHLNETMDINDLVLLNRVAGIGDGGIFQRDMIL